MFFQVMPALGFRMRQNAAGLNELSKLLEAGCDAAIWLGDMNWKEQEMNIRGWSDLWEEVCADPGPTFHANQGNVCAVSARLDRILTFGVNCQDSSMTRLGTSKIPGTDVFPSDHYGLFAAVVLR